MKARERDLAHDADPVRFGNAMLKCEGFAPDCSYHGRCQFNGQCFASPAHIVAARMTWADVQGDVIRVRQSKTGEMLDIACHPALRAYLDELRRVLDNDGTRRIQICQTATGKAFDSNSLSSAVYREIRAIEGMPRDRSFHGLRYAAGSRLDEAGCTVSQIESVLGHRTFRMALKYASQRLRSKAAIAKIEVDNAG